MPVPMPAFHTSQSQFNMESAKTYAELTISYNHRKFVQIMNFFHFSLSIHICPKAKMIIKNTKRLNRNIIKKIILLTSHINSLADV